ncbi:MAG TPA: hypothetical protein VEC11_08235 [Allosphingosinicella sp.]|nr:hypothetical protein [Allosphingosinicella sp.]
MKAVALLLGLLAAAPAAAQEIPALSLAPGEAITLRFDDGGRVGPPERGRAAWSRYDLFAARHLAGIAPPEAPETEGTLLPSTDEARPDPIPADVVRVRALSIDGRHTLLVVENGQGRALAYRARMTTDQGTHPTDVCVVLPRLPSYEHWAFPIHRLELYDFRFIPWAPGRRPTCE